MQFLYFGAQCGSDNIYLARSHTNWFPFSTPVRGDSTLFSFSPAFPWSLLTTHPAPFSNSEANKLIFFGFWMFVVASHNGAQAGLERSIHLPRLPERWDYRNTPSPAGCSSSHPVPLSYIQPLVKFDRTSEALTGTSWVPHIAFRLEGPTGQTHAQR